MYNFKHISIMNLIKSTFFATVLLLLVACGADKAESAFDNGEVKVGSTYENLIEKVGDPQNEIKTDKGIVASYMTVLKGKYFIVLLEKDSDDIYRVKEFTNDLAKGATYELSIKE